MSANLHDRESEDLPSQEIAAEPASSPNLATDELADSDEEDDEPEEPKLKYDKLTGSLTNVYRNGDSTSSFTVAGDKMVLGTHNGNIHVLSLPNLQSLKTYHAHSATITSLSVSPVPPPPSVSLQSEAASARPTTLRSPPSSVRAAPTSTASSASPRAPRAPQPSIPNTPNNAIHIATSSLDGHVCISSLLDPNDVQLRNFARPVQAVALSPDYKSDRTYLSGGLAGQLILTIGGRSGVSTDANTNSSAAAATSGFLGAFGLSADRGKDVVLHSGHGAISCIKWSLSGKWVVWVTEAGIKIMRSHLKLGSENQEDEWKRIAHADRPHRRVWEEMAGVWRGRAEWFDERKLEEDETTGPGASHVNGVNGTPEKGLGRKISKVERLVVGWGDTAWILHVTEGPSATSTSVSSGGKVVGTAEIIHKLFFDDCVISGLSLFTPTLLAVLAYRTRDDDNKPIQQPDSTVGSTSAQAKTARKGRHNRQTGLAPQLRLIDIHTGNEDRVDELSISRFETLSAQDYHLATLFMPHPSAKEQQKAERGALEGIWEGTRNATRLFSSGASVRSGGSSEGNGPRASIASPTSSAIGVPPPVPPGRRIGIADAHPFAASPGLKLFIQSPYDCAIAVKTDLKDRLHFLLQLKDYRQAWGLLDKHPEIVDAAGATIATGTAEPQPEDAPSTPSSQAHNDSLADFFADDTASTRSANGGDLRAFNEKRRIGELWLRQLISASQWEEAGRVAGKVLGTSRRWDYWVSIFDQQNRVDEIASHIPASARLPDSVYKTVLRHYIFADLQRFQELLEIWEPEKELYDSASIRRDVESRLRSEDIQEESQDWRILTEALAKLYLADGSAREALACYIRVQNAEKAMELIRRENRMDIITAEDVPDMLMLNIDKEQMRSAPLDELEEASSEAVNLLVSEALKGTLLPATVIGSLESRGKSYRMFLYFYLHALWTATESNKSERKGLKSRVGPLKNEGHALVEDHADLAVELFAEYDRELLMTFLEASEVYNYEKAAALCRQRGYTSELVYVLGKTGQTKDALMLIINDLQDVKRAIDFTKDHPDLWDDLLDYSMDKPIFIRGLLEEVGTAIDPIQLVRRIPEGLPIEGLKDGIAKMMKEYEIQFSISEGVAKVLDGEVTMGMDTLRAGQKKGVKFEVVHDSPKQVELAVIDPPLKPTGEAVPMPDRKVEKEEAKQVQPGHCVGCGDAFSEDEKETLIGFACGHVYHLSCLLKLNPDTADPAMISRLTRQLGSADSTDEGYAGRSVGAKVAHAHIIKNVLRGGCQHCIVPEGA